MITKGLSEINVIMFFLLVFSIWGAMLAHIFYRTQSLLNFKRKHLWGTVPAFFFLGFLYIPARMLLHEHTAESLARHLAYIGSWSVGILCIFWTLLFILELCSVLLVLSIKQSVWRASKRIRRIFAAALWGSSLIIALVGFTTARSTPSITRLQVTIPGAKAASFAVIVDAHLGAVSSEEQWRRTLKATEELNPDALLIPGDLIDDQGNQTKTQVAMLRDFFPERPVYVTMGNHEFYSGPDLFSELCRRFGFMLLRQNVKSISPGLQIAGIDDSHFVEPGRAVSKVLKKAEGALLFLTHRPATANFLKDRPMTLILAGHTHGGQTIPMVFIAALGNGGFRSGYYRLGKAHLYVSNGTGVWGPPIRLMAPPELLFIEVLPGNRFHVEPSG